MKKTCILFFVFTAFCFSVSAQSSPEFQPSIEQYLNIRSAGSPTFSPDGKRIAYLTNITGTSQIWMVDANGGYPEQITAYEDSVSFVEWSPGGNGLVFGKAVGGNENTQIFWMSNDGSHLKALTDNPKVRHNFGGFSHDGKRIYYSSNKRDANYFDVYSMEIPGGTEKLIYQNDGSNWFAAASNDDSRIIVSRSSIRFSNDNDLYLVDTKTGDATHLTPHNEATLYTDVKFLSNDRIIFGTNQNSEFVTLSTMDIKTKRIIPQDAEGVGDLEATAITRSGQTLVTTNNFEGYTQMYVRALFVKNSNAGILPAVVKASCLRTEPMAQNARVRFENLNCEREAAARRHRYSRQYAGVTYFSQVIPIDLPAKGIASGLELSRDGKKLVFVFNSPKHPSDVWTYDFASEKMKQVTKSSTLGIPRESFVEPELIKYKTFDGREISAWYYKPNKEIALLNEWIRKSRNFHEIKYSSNPPMVNNPPKLPVIVSVHGGPASQSRRDFSALNQYYLSRGFAILEPNVRGSTGYGKTFSHLDDIEKREDSVKDLAAAVEWLKTEGGADESKIAVIGGSYGGYMVMAAITLYPEMFAAAVNTVGIVNWETFLKNTSGYRRTQREVEYGFLDKNLEFLRSVSPIYKVDKIKTPLFVIHGKNDPRVPYTEAEQLVKALKKRNVAVQYELFDDEGHGIRKLENRLELYPKVANFLEKYLK